MKKITLKISVFLLLALFALQVQAQPCPEVWTENGTYKISTCGLTPELYMTINGSTGALEWAAEIPGEDPTQVWTITDHRTPAGPGLMEVWATIPGVGNFTMAVDDITNYPVVTLIARPGDPVSGTGTGDWSGKDQFQRRRTAGFGGPGNNALFFQSATGTNSRYGVIPTAAGDPVQFDGGGIDALRFVLVAALSTEDFDTSSIFISNPVNNELSIKGLTSNVKQVSVYSLLGAKVLTKKVDGQSAINVDVSALSSGFYIVELSGESGRFTKKIIKQ
ncbi:T9SS type A sorting domain-containing protein [Mariniflexile sp. HNIBRBA6329]|uniref:T9SS type A sorting domain-containing protein n=1 Tax=Mariniflexile sp. HNIBRBA6329 TaxID=3373088 RepID=UPI003745E581